MPFANVNGVEICYEVSGNPSDEPLLLVMGFTAQLNGWPDELVEALVERGFFVIRHDNRDSGLSSKTEGDPPDVMSVMAKAIDGEDVSDMVPYSLSAMSDDAFGVLTDLGIERAHIVGASMGGMIVQTMAIEHPERLLSVTSIMSTTGDQTVGRPEPEAMAALLAPPPADRESAIAQAVETSRILGGPLWDRARAEKRATEAHDRSFHPEGAPFQLAAIYATGDRTERLAAVDVPFLVIHGRVDSIIGWSGGLATAEAVPNSDLVVLAQMGHDLPLPLIDQIADSIRTVAHRPAVA